MSKCGQGCTFLKIRFIVWENCWTPGIAADKQVMPVARSACYQLQLELQLWPFLEKKDLITITHVLVTSRLNSCNLLCVGLTFAMAWKCQLVQNTTRSACMMMVTSRSNHITPILWEWHWLPITFRAHFKVQMWIYKAL